MTALQVLLVLGVVGGVGAIAGASGGGVTAGAVLGLAAGAVLSGVLHLLTIRKLDELSARARRLTGGPPASGPQPGAGWGTLADEIDGAARRLGHRLEEVAAERGRILRLLEGLPPAILLFSAHGLSYANAAAREIFRLAGVRRVADA